jgi:hypothetical protein
MDSLRFRLGKLNQDSTLGNIKAVGDKVQDVQQSVTNKLQTLEQTANGKFQKFNEQGAGIGSLNLPQVPGVQSFSQPSLPSSKIPALEGANVSLPATHLPSDHLPMPELNTPNIGQDLSKSVNLPKTDIQLDVGKRPKQFTKVSDAAAKAKGLTADAKKIAGGNIDSLEQVSAWAEEKLSEQLQEEAALLDNRVEMIKKWNSDPAVAKEMALAQAKEQATNHFLGHEQELMAVMEQLTKLKTKYKDAEGTLDLFKKRQQPLAGKTLRDRLVLGLTMQFQWSSHVWADVNPYIGYKLSSRFTSGIGWNERISFSVKDPRVYSHERIFGPRLYTEFQFREHIYFKAETEWMHAQVHTPTMQLQEQSPTTNWVWTTFVGVKNVFSLSKRWKGHVQILYNVYNPDKRSPYADRINVRFGFERLLIKDEGVRLPE